MSWAFIQSMKAHPGQSYVQILQRTRALLSPKYSQIPQLSVCLFTLFIYHLALQFQSQLIFRACLLMNPY
jgi:hypothetical protein